MYNKLLTIFSFLLSANLFTIRSQIAVDVSEIKGPVCIIRDSINNVTLSMSPAHSRYNVVVSDGFAHVSLKQLFINPGFKIQSMVYVFPLPDNGSVNAMQMAYKGQVYKALIYERKRAEQIYDSIKAKGQNAALLIQDRPNVFQQAIANIGSGDSAYIEIKISMPLKYNSGEYELAIPTMVGERFQSSGASTVPSSGKLWNPPEDRDGSTIQINILFQTGFPISEISSPTHSLVVKEFSAFKEELIQRDLLNNSIHMETENATAITLTESKTYPNRDFILRFKREAENQDFTVVSQFDSSYGVGHFALTLFPNDTIKDTLRSPLEVVLLVDISGSQSGWPLAKEKEIASDILRRLKPTDKITVLAFSDYVYWAFDKKSPSNATDDTLKKAAEFINNLSTMGGTQLLDGVRAALSVPSTSEYQRYYIFLTDGFITNETAILDEIKNHSTKPTIFTFGAGNNLNRYFLESCATVGNGFATEVTQSENAASMVEPAWSKISSPQLKNLSVVFSNQTIKDIITPRTNTLYAGDPFQVYGTYTSGGQTTVTLKGYQNGNPVVFEKTVNLAQNLTANFMLPQIWAKQKITQLSIDQGNTESRKDSIILISEKYQVLSNYTAFLATSPQQDKESSTPIKSQTTTIIKLSNIRFICNNKGLQLMLPEGEFVTDIIVYDVSGRTIFKSKYGRFNHLTKFYWDGTLSNGNRLRNGRYILRVMTSTGRNVKYAFTRNLI